MRSTRAAAVSALLLLPLGLLAGCGGDEPEDSAKPTQRSTPEDDQKIRSCQVTAELSGAETLSASGKGRAVVDSGGGPDAFYEFQQDDLMLTAYSEGEDFSPSVTVTVGGTTYSTLTEPAGLDIGTNGKSATVDSPAVGSDSEAGEVQVVSEFTCK